jgi:hypothetical protein
VLLLWPDSPDGRQTGGVDPAGATTTPARLEWAPEVELVSPTSLPGKEDAGPAPSVHVPSPEDEAVDLFAGPAPELIEKALMIAEDGRPLHAKRVKELYQYGKDHPGDARPHILLALDSKNRGWHAFTASHYLQAVRENPDARRDPRILPDLLQIAGRRHDSDRAQEAVLEIYGAGALPAVRSSIEEALSVGDEHRAERLGELVGILEGLEP